MFIDYGWRLNNKMIDLHQLSNPKETQQIQRNPTNPTNPKKPNKSNETQQIQNKPNKPKVIFLSSPPKKKSGEPLTSVNCQGQPRYNTLAVGNGKSRGTPHHFT